MKNGYVHDHVLLHTAEEQFRAQGAEVLREYPVEVQGRRGFIDFLIQCRSWRLAGEAENGSRRVGWDIDKARAAEADGLMVFVPSCRVARACWKAVRRKRGQGSVGDLWICVLTLGAFQQWLRINSRLFSALFETSKTFPVSSANNITTYTEYPS